MEYLALYASYGSVAAIVLIIIKVYPLSIWPEHKDVYLESPWKEFGIALIACVVIIGIGQLYVAGIRLPADNPWLDSINQIFIFSPILALMAFRDKSFDLAFINKGRAHFKLISGLILAIIAITIYTYINGSSSLSSTLINTYSFSNVSYLVQVLLEDITIAVLFIRLKKATSLKIALVVVPTLFAIGHIPPMIAKGVSLEVFFPLFLDAGLGLFLIYAIDRTKDILWFWMVHFAMDMMQFYA